MRAATCAIAALCLSPARSEVNIRDEIARQRLQLTNELNASDTKLASKQAECATRFVVNSCVSAAKSSYYTEQQALNKKLAVLNKRERELDAAARANDRVAQQAEQAARIAAKPDERMTPAQRDTAAGAAASAAEFAAKQADAKQRKAEQEAKLKLPAPPAKPTAVPRSANAAEMAAAALNEQARLKDIAVRKAAIDKKRADKQGAPLPIDPPLNPSPNPTVK